jgi:multidrug resistance efflux pump
MQEQVSLLQTQKEQQQHESIASDDGLTQLHHLRHFNGNPAAFWPQFIETVGTFVGFTSVLLLLNRNGQQWQRLALWPDKRSLLQAPQLQTHIDQLATQAYVSGIHQPKHQRLRRQEQVTYDLLAQQLPLPQGQPTTVLIGLLSDATSLTQARRDLQCVLDIPEHYLLNRLLQLSNKEAIHAVQALDLLIAINETKGFQHAVMTLCNELCSRIPCDRVMFGWLQGPYIRLYAISHMEKFNRKTEVIQQLEQMMEEAVDQDAELLYPRSEESITVVRSHQHYARNCGVEGLLSVPLRCNNEVVGIITCERNHDVFNHHEARILRLYADQVVYRLHESQQRSRWFGTRWWLAFKQGLSKLFGVEKTLVKAMSILFAALLGYLLFGSLPYRVEAPFILQTDALSFVNSPFDGYVQAVEVKVGDVVKQHEPLLQLDMDQLLLQESEATADVSRYQREEEKARAENALADMRIAAAMKEQSIARLEEVQYFLSRANLQAPADGIIVEGELDKMLGAPVKQGDVLYKVAALDQLYIEMAVDERDIHQITNYQAGEFTFLSRPDLHFALQVEHLNPVAEVKEEVNAFVVRGQLIAPVENWWRPGMSGIAKIDVGERTPGWILLHRTIDFLRMWLWW